MASRRFLVYLPTRFLRPLSAPARHLCSAGPGGASSDLDASYDGEDAISSSSLVPRARTRTPLEKQFDSWVERLRPGFGPDDVVAALRAQPDIDLAIDLFRWTALRPGYRHNPAVYLAMLRIAVSARCYAHAEKLIEEVLAGACPPDLALFNAAIHFCCSRRHLFSRAFDLFKKMQQQQRRRIVDSEGAGVCRPTIETYSMLLGAVLRRFGKPPVCYVYLHTVRSLVRQMKASGVIPDTFALNLVIKAYSKCQEMDEAIRVFKEMGLYGCEPNAFSYGYIVGGLCEKGRIEQAMDYFREMREKGLLPGASVYMAVICSLALERRFEAAINVVLDMLGNGMRPDVLTYRTVMEGLCREGRAEDAFQLLDELSQRRGAMDKKVHTDLLDGLHWLRQSQE